MTDRLAGKICLVTGAGQGIGKAIADLFAIEGAKVIAVDLRFNESSQAQAQVEQLVLDATDADAIAKAAARYGAVNVLVNCVGIVPDGTILDCPIEEFDRCMAINVRSMVLTCGAFLPAMVERRDGAIINIASVVSSVMAAPRRFAYATSKAAVIGLTMAIARDFIDKGIRCNAISPGTVESPSLEQRLTATGDMAAARAAFIARQPMGRLGTVDEIAAAAVLLAGDEMQFMTGSNMVIDGGMSL